MPVIHKMSSVQVLPLGNYNGTHVMGPVDIADDVSSVLISIARCTTAAPTIWPNASTILTITPEVSVDGGQTWIESGKSVSPGGVLVIQHVELANSISGGSLAAAVNGITRQYRCTVDIANGPLRSSATVEVT